LRWIADEVEAATTEREREKERERVVAPKYRGHCRYTLARIP
jgi:hypothetical protein